MLPRKRQNLRTELWAVGSMGADGTMVWYQRNKPAVLGDEMLSSSAEMVETIVLSQLFTHTSKGKFIHEHSDITCIVKSIIQRIKWKLPVTSFLRNISYQYSPSCGYSRISCTSTHIFLFHFWFFKARFPCANISCSGIRFVD